MRVWIYDRGSIITAALFLTVGFFAGLFCVRQVEPLRTLSHDLNHLLLGIDDHPEHVRVPVAAMPVRTVPNGVPIAIDGPTPVAPVPARVPAPVPIPVAPWTGATTVTIEPGVNQFTYTGFPATLLTLLAPGAGKFSLVRYRVPGGEWVAYGAGQAGSEGAWVLPGYEVSITATESFELRW